MVLDSKIKQIYPSIEYIHRKCIQAWSGMVVDERDFATPHFCFAGREIMEREKLQCYVIME